MKYNHSVFLLAVFGVLCMGTSKMNDGSSIGPSQRQIDEWIYQADEVMLNRDFGSVNPGDDEKLTQLTEKLLQAGVVYKYEFR